MVVVGFVLWFRQRTVTRGRCADGRAVRGRRGPRRHAQSFFPPHPWVGPNGPFLHRSTEW